MRGQSRDGGPAEKGFLQCARENGIDAHISPIRYRWGERTGHTHAWVVLPTHHAPQCLERLYCYSNGLSFPEIAVASTFDGAYLEHDVEGER